MGTVRATLRLSSSDVLSTNLDFTCVTDILADSGTLQRVKVLATSAGNTAQQVHKPNEKADRSYLYVKNLDAVTENYVVIYENSNDTNVAKLAGGEFAFIPVDPGQDLLIFGTRVDQLVEFGSFGLDSSAVRYG
tara:strand:- start:2743 stop:3144 length:402 start_codon:yes stop_codon:yes gene_type:complete